MKNTKPNRPRQARQEGQVPAVSRKASQMRALGFTQASDWALHGARLVLKGIGRVRITMHRPLPKNGTLKTLVLRRRAKGWYANLAVPVRAPKTALHADNALCLLPIKAPCLFVKKTNISENSLLWMNTPMKNAALIVLLSFLVTPLMAQEAMRLDLGLGGGSSSEPPSASTIQDPARQPQEPIAFEEEAVVLPNTQLAQAAPDLVSSEDKDHLIACSIVYQRISDLYEEDKRIGEAQSFRQTAYAYSQVSHGLYAEEVGIEPAYNVMIRRMETVSAFLNQESQDLGGGDLAVIEKWLPWCDERGGFVQTALDTLSGRTTP